MSFNGCNFNNNNLCTEVDNNVRMRTHIQCRINQEAVGPQFRTANCSEPWSFSIVCQIKEKSEPCYEMRSQAIVLYNMA